MGNPYELPILRFKPLFLNLTNSNYKKIGTFF